MPQQAIRKTIRLHNKGLRWDSYLIKRLSPADFLDEKDGFPLNFFTKGPDNLTMYEQAMAKMGQAHVQTRAERERQLLGIATVLSKAVLTENGKKFDVKSFMERPATAKNTKKMMVLFWQTLNFSFKRFLGEVPINIINAKTIFILAKRFSKTPIEILFPEGDYTEMDAWMFNMYIASVGIEEENREIKKLNKKR